MTHDERKTGMARLARGFMKPDIDEAPCYQLEGRNGSVTIPGDVFGPSMALDSLAVGHTSNDRAVLHEARDYYEGRIETVTYLGMRWIARLSAPGYLDCTEWADFDTEAEAEAYLVETYGDDDTDDDDEGTDDDE